MDSRALYIETLANAEIMARVRRQIARKMPGQDVDDVMQETLLNAWKAIDKFRGDCSLSTWLVRIAINTRINHQVRMSARPPAEGADPNLLEDEDTPPDDYQAEQRKAWLWANVAAMPREWRDVITGQLNGDSDALIASRLGIPIGTVKSRGNRAKAILREVYYEKANAPQAPNRSSCDHANARRDEPVLQAV